MSDACVLRLENAPYQTIPMCPVRLVSIVDDDESARLATESLVRSLGWPTRTFDSAEAYLQSMPPAGSDGTGCLISDVRMPGMSGIEMFEHLLALGAAPPTLLMTAFPTDALRAGGHDWRPGAARKAARRRRARASSDACARHAVIESQRRAGVICGSCRERHVGRAPNPSRRP